MKNFRLFSSLLILLIVGLGNSIIAQTRHTGVNLPELSAYSTVHMFADAMKQNTGWFVQHTDESDFNIDSVGNVPITIPQDANGYPTQVPFVVNGDSLQVHCILLSNQQSPWYYPAGDYTLILTGTGSVKLTGDVNQTFTAPGTHSVNITNPTDEGVHLTILQSSVSNPISEINFIFPNHMSTFSQHPFNQKFLEIIQPWEALRFMKATQTEENPIQNWSDRTHPGYYTYHKDADNGGGMAGIPWEVIIQLCNQTGEDPWINIPYAANDAYVDSLAQLFRDNLDTNRTIYIEYSNETWNYYYTETHQYVNNQGLTNNYSADTFQAGIMYTTVRSIQIFEIFEQVFGSSSSQRLKKVVSSGGWDFPAATIYQTVTSTTFNPNQTMPDAIAVAPYFGGEIVHHLDTLQYCTYTTSQILDSLEASISPIMQEAMANAYRLYADSLGTELYTYESGQHLALPAFQNVNDSCLNTLLTAVNNHPRMTELYCMYMDSLHNTYNLDLDMAFVLAESYEGNFFGILESQWQDTSTSVKWQAFNNCAFSIVGKNPVLFDSDFDCEVYPNPFTTMINLNYSMENAHNVSFSLYNVLGKEMKISELKAISGKKSAGAHQLSIPATQLDSGIYFLKINIDGKVLHKRLLKI